MQQSSKNKDDTSRKDVISKVASERVDHVEMIFVSCDNIIQNVVDTNQSSSANF